MLGSDIEIRRIHQEDAIQFMEKFERLGNIGLGVWHWGLYSFGRLSSVVSFGSTSFSTERGFLAEISKSTKSAVVQLTRGATAPWAHKHWPSHLISKASKEMYRWKGPLIIVAYANTELNEIGTIYQACNAIYTGLTVPKGQANYLVKGRCMSGWTVRKLFGTRSLEKLRKIDPDVEVYPLLPKHRYVLLACSKLKKKRIKKLLFPYVLPYPSRLIITKEYSF